MKRMMTLLLCMLLAIGLLAGCGAGQEVAETTAAVESNVQVVTNVDELLAAIGSDTEIQMEAGTYSLSDASNYGKESGSPYYVWQESSDGYELKLRGVQNLTIRGSGKDTTILTADPRYANVLILQNCSNVVLEGFTAGHTVEPGECSGGVLVIQGCMDISMQGLGLYGCGMIGLRADLCTNVRITDSDIYDCSSTGVAFDSTDIVVVDNCRLYDLGDPTYGGSAVFYVTSSNSVEITNCEVKDNVMQTLVSATPCDTVVLKNNTFTGNRIRGCAFSLWKGGMVLDSNTFENNVIRMWYDSEAGGAVDANGKAITEAMLEAQHVQTEEDVPLAERTEVHVSTVDEFLAAIAPNTEIVLEAELYDFSTATGYGETNTEYYHWEDNFDGPSLVITGVDNLTIRSNDGNLKAHTLAAIPRYANVLTFNMCSNISLSGFTAGHTQEPGSCIGGVLMFRDSDSVSVDNCGLYGCGILGIQAEYGSDITVTNCDIYECSQGGIQMYSIDGITITGCTFRDLGGPNMTFHGCENVTVDGEAVDGSFTSGGTEYGWM